MRSTRILPFLILVFLSSQAIHSKSSPEAQGLILPFQQFSLVKGRATAITWQQGTGLRANVFLAAVNGHLIERWWDGARWNWNDHGLPPGTIVGSPPSAIGWLLDGAIRINVFFTGLNGRLIERYWNGNAWNWNDHGLPPLNQDAGVSQGGGIAAVSTPSVLTYQGTDSVRRLSVFVKSSDGRLIERYWDGNAWNWNDHKWMPSSDMFGYRLASSPVSIPWDQYTNPFPQPVNRVMVMMTGINGRLIERSWDGGKWNWTDHGLPPPKPGVRNFLSEPAAVTYRTATAQGSMPRFNIFLKQGDGSLIERYWTGSSWEWSDHGRPPGTLPDGTQNLISSAPVIAAWKAGTADRINVFARGANGNLVERYWTGGSWQWNEHVVPVADGRPAATAMIAATPAIFTYMSGSDIRINVFASRADGNLIERYWNGSQWVWNDSHGPSDSLVIQPSKNAKERAGPARCNDVFEIDTIFPQWSSVESTDAPQVLEGVVVGSRMATLDNPLNHSRATDRSYPTVTHDWNILVAPDPKYQYLLSETNLLGDGAETGTVEVEWELSPDKLSMDAIPNVGDRVYIRGRWIFDCGHPPYHTEIHPPTALIAVRQEPITMEDTFRTPDVAGRPVPAGQAVIRLSGNGGPVNFMPSGYIPIPGVNDFLTAYLKLRFKDSIDLSKLDPSTGIFKGYTAYARPTGDVKHEFDVPLPPRPSATARPTWFTIGSFSGLTAEARPADNPTYYHVTIPPGAHSAATVTFIGHWADSLGRGISSPTARKLSMRFSILPNSTHDPRKGLLSWSPTFVSDLAGGDDGRGEWVMYIGVNGRWYKTFPGPQITVPLNVTTDQILRITVNGFECDLSCGEIWDDNPTELPNDRIGSVLQVFDLANNFGLGRSYSVYSQPTIGISTRADRDTQGDYSLSFWVAAR